MSDQSAVHGHGDANSGAEQDTLPNPNEARDSMPVVPSTHEHGVFGYDQNAVGGFGEDYSHQVAEGSEPEAAIDLPTDERDQALIKTVQKALGRAHIDAGELRVEVEAARVTLFGTVNHGFEKSDLEARARAVPGVASVTSRITAREPHSTPK